MGFSFQGFQRRFNPDGGGGGGGDVEGIISWRKRASSAC